jgi:hypothetical protein
LFIHVHGSIVKRKFIDNFHFFTATVAQTFLKREWLDAEGQREKGAKHNENLQFLLK